MTTTSGFCMVSMDPNSGPPTFLARDLSLEPPPHILHPSILNTL